jgi:NitT/TauT family transport system substrate-binding protein
MKGEKNMFNRTITIITLLLSFATVAHAETEVRVNRMIKYASSEPLLYKIAELLPDYAAKEGIKDVKVSYVDILESTKANEALLLGQIDIIFGGVNSFGILFDKDPSKVKLLAGAEEYDQWLVCSNPKIKSLKDITATTKIAMKGMNSGEQMQLRQYTAAKFGDKEYAKFDANIVVMPRDQAVAQMTKENPEIDCGIVGVPWQNIAVKKGAHIVAHNEDPTKTVGVLNTVYATTKWLDANPKLARAWVAAQKAAIAEFEKNPRPMLINFMTKDEVVDPTLNELVDQKKENHDVYQYKTDSALKYMDFMYRVGILNGAGKDKKHSDMVWDEKLVK